MRRAAASGTHVEGGVPKLDQVGLVGRGRQIGQPGGEDGLRVEIAEPAVLENPLNVLLSKEGGLTNTASSISRSASLCRNTTLWSASARMPAEVGMTFAASIPSRLPLRTTVRSAFAAETGPVPRPIPGARKEARVSVASRGPLGVACSGVEIGVGAGGVKVPKSRCSGSVRCSSANAGRRLRCSASGPPVVDLRVEGNLEVETGEARNRSAALLGVRDQLSRQRR